jgi:hypothetical protein
VNLQKTTPESTTSSDSKGLYWAGSISAALFVVAILIPIVLLLLAPQPPLSDGTAVLTYIANHKLVYIVELVCFVGLSLPALVFFLSLATALKQVNSSGAAIGGLIAIASEIVALAYNSSPPSLNTGLLGLSNQYVAATSEAQRLSSTNAAEALMAVSNAVNAAGILTALGIAVLSWVMMRDGWWKRVGNVGMVTGIVGMVSELLRDVIGAGYFAYGMLLPAWFIACGYKLYRLAKTAN